MEQQFKMRQIEDALNQSKEQIDDIITLFLALQKQCFVLGNNVSNLVSKWPIQTPVQSVGLNLDESIQQEK